MIDAKAKRRILHRTQSWWTECNNTTIIISAWTGIAEEIFLTWCPLIQWPWLIFQRAQLAGCLSFVLLCSYLLEELHIFFRKMLVPPRCIVDVPDYKAQLTPFQRWEKVLSVLSVQKTSHNMYVISNLLNNLLSVIWLSILNYTKGEQATTNQPHPLW